EVAKTAPQGGLIRGHFEFKQGEYEETMYRNTFGGIDRLDFEADVGARTVRVWFQDRYEWHPVYPRLYSKFVDDDYRPSNPLHAAFVEMKDQGAADFWMKGEATMRLP